MTDRLRRLRSTIAAASAAAIVLSVPAYAHEDAAPISLQPDRVSPGGTIAVQLEDRSADELLHLYLVNENGRVELGTVVVDEEGHAMIAVGLPPELPTGLYAVSAVDAGETSISAALAVEGTPILPPEEQEQGSRDEDDGLLAPLPSGWQRSLAGPIRTAVPVTTTTPVGPALPGGAAWLAVAGLLLAGVAMIALRVLAARRR